MNVAEKDYCKYFEALSKEWGAEEAGLLLNENIVETIKHKFNYYSSAIKLKIIVSFFFLNDQTRLSFQDSLLKIVSMGEVDFDIWVKVISRLVSSFIITKHINFNETDTETCYKLVKFIESKVPESSMPTLIPHPVRPINVLTEFTEETKKRIEDKEIFLYNSSNVNQNHNSSVFNVNEFIDSLLNNENDELVFKPFYENKVLKDR